MSNKRDKNKTSNAEDATQSSKKKTPTKPSPDRPDKIEKQATKKEAQKKAAERAAEELAKTEPWLSEEAISGLFDRIGEVTSSAFAFAKKTTDTSYKMGKALMQSQDQLKLMLSAGQSLKDLREVAGLTINELNDALQLKDHSLLEAVENGTATLSFELILRLSALLARNDPIPFILKYSRAYSPETWKLLHDWGAGRLPLQYQREREFINIFRSKDQARQLSDEGYAKVLDFTREAFNMSLHFVAEQENSIETLRESMDSGRDEKQKDKKTPSSK